MRRLKRIKPTPSLVISSIALFASLGGVSYGVATGSIDSREIKNNTVSSKDIRNNSVRSKDVRNGSLLKRDFKAGQLPTGPVGPAGPPGSPGRSGTNGFGTLAYTGVVGARGSSRRVSLAPGADDDFGVACPDGTFPTGGTALVLDSNGAPIAGAVVAEDIAVDNAGQPAGWYAFFHNPDSANSVDAIVEAICANANRILVPGGGRSGIPLRPRSGD